MKLLTKPPLSLYLACSGGVDSMVVLHFLLQGRRDVTVLYFNHKTDHGEDAGLFLKSFCQTHNIPFITESYQGSKQTEESWRKARYEFFDKFQDKPIITCHHLNDNIETYLFSSIKGTPKFIPYRRKHIIRPFLLVTKEEFLQYAKTHSVVWCEDPSNTQEKYSRNKIRHSVIPVLKEINPGLEKTFRRKCFLKYQQDFLENLNAT